MSDDLDAGLYAALADDPELRRLVSTYQPSGGYAPKPAIFMTRQAPGDATRPYILAGTRVADVPFDTKSRTGREHRRDIRCYADASDDPKRLVRIAERVRAIFHRRRIDIPGYATVLCDVTGPFELPTDDTVEGLGVTVRLVLQALERRG